MRFTRAPGRTGGRRRRIVHWLAIGGLILAHGALAGHTLGQVRFDFETGDLQGWRLMEGRFGALISDRAMCRNTPDRPYPKQGRWHMSTTELADGGYNDAMTGVVESPVFLLTGPRVSLMVGGGSHLDTYVALCTEDGREVRHARGANAETMGRVEWNVPDLVGKRVFLSVVDRNKGSWGHVTLDDVRADGALDNGATERVRASYETRKEAVLRRERQQIEARARQRTAHKARLQDETYLFGRGKPRVYSGQSLGAISMPVGGIGGGCIQMDGQGRAAIWQIFGNYKAIALPDSFLAVRCKSASKPPVVRALQGADAGPFKGIRTVRFRGEYPFGRWTFSDPTLPLRIELEVFSPMIPGNARDSAFPCAIFRVAVTNTGKEVVTVNVMAVQQNAVGVNAATPPIGRRSPAYGGNVNRSVHEAGLTMLSFERQAPNDAGTMALAARGRSVIAATDTGDISDLFAVFEQTGRPSRTSPSDGVPQASSPAPSPEGSTYNGALAASLSLKPGASATQTFILTWHFPGIKHGGEIAGWQSEGSLYETQWPDALSVARELDKRLAELTQQTRLYHDTFYASNLPVWLLDRMSSQTAILRSMTCFWGRDGYFGVWEGCNAEGGCCAGNCSHVWHYAQAHARLWPEIGRAMREQELRWITPEGALPHRQPNAAPAFDGQCGTILGAYREHLTSRDGRWLAQRWASIRAALDYLISRWDPDENGVLTGPQWNTLDENLGGSSSWLGSLYIAALRAGEQMALIQGEGATAGRYSRIASAASERQDATLFNGEYYIQIPDATPYRDYGQGCHIDQVLGQWWADMLNLGRVYPTDHVRSALGALHRHNFLYDFADVPQAPRKFVHDDDAGTKMITWPRGGRPEAERQMLYADEVMTGFEYAAAAAMVSHGMIEEGFRTVRAIADRYDGRLRTGLSPGNYSAWGYSGNPFGDDECGKFYGRSLSSWSLLLACQGFVHDGPGKMIGFRPQWRPENHVSFFTSCEGWGLFTQKRAGAVQRERIEVRRGRLAVVRLLFETANRSAAPKVAVSVGGKPIACRVSASGTDVEIVLERAVTLTASSALEVTIR